MWLGWDRAGGTQGLAAEPPSVMDGLDPSIHATTDPSHEGAASACFETRRLWRRSSA